MVVSLSPWETEVSADMCWSGVCEGHVTDVSRSGMYRNVQTYIRVHEHFTPNIYLICIGGCLHVDTYQTEISVRATTGRVSHHFHWVCVL